MQQFAVLCEFWKSFHYQLRTAIYSQLYTMSSFINILHFQFSASFASSAGLLWKCNIFKISLEPPPPNLKIFLRLPFIEIFLWNQVIILAQGLLIFLLPTCSQRSCSSQMDFQDISLVLNGVLFSAGDFLFSWPCQNIALVFSKMHFIEAYSQNHEIC